MPGPSATRPLTVLATLLVVATGQGGVAVLVNHTKVSQAVRVSAASGQSNDVTIEPGFARPLFSKSPLHATVATPLGPQAVRLVDGAAYRLAESAIPGVARLSRIGFGETPGNDPPWRESAGGAVGPARWAIAVLICVDEDDPTRDALWQARLRARVEAASEVLVRTAGVSLRVAGFREWRSDDRVTDFLRSFAEFQREVDPPAGHVAIGFTSQYVVESGPRKLGGTRGSLRRHIMLREWSPQVTEVDRRQLLLHELGHHLGAAHSPEPTSVMRPLLGNRRERLRRERVRFDVASTLVMALVGDEVRSRGVTDSNQLSPWTRRRLADIYAALRQALPEDPAAAVQAARIEVGSVTAVVRGPSPLAALTAAAVANRKLPLADTGGGATRRVEDALTEHLVRAAAGAADTPEAGAELFLISIGVGLDDSGALAKLPQLRQRIEKLEPARSRAARLNVLGEPTAWGRRDTVKHFAVSAALAALLGPNQADALGFAKEAIDAQGGTGFSFADIAANRAGIRFAEATLAGRLPLSWISENFEVDDFVPEIADLPEGMPSPKVVERYGGRGDKRFEELIDLIDARIDGLPPYRPLGLRIAPLRESTVD